MIQVDSGLEALTKLGLSEAEARVYSALARLGVATVEQLSKSTGIHRRTVYDALATLVQNGLIVTSFLNEKKVYSTTGARSFEALVDVHKKQAEEFLLAQEKQRVHPEPVVRVFHGKEGVKSVFADKLHEGKPIFWYAGAMQGARYYIKDYYPLWNAKRERLKIPIKMIFIDEPEVRQILAPLKFFEGRSIPRYLYTNSPWWLYGNKLVITFWRDEPFSVMIEDEDAAATYRNFFELIWTRAKPFRKTSP